MRDRRVDVGPHTEDSEDLSKEKGHLDLDPFSDYIYGSAGGLTVLALLILLITSDFDSQAFTYRASLKARSTFQGATDLASLWGGVQQPTGPMPAPMMPPAAMPMPAGASSAETEELRNEVKDLKAKLSSLEGQVQRSTCLPFFILGDGFCTKPHPPQVHEDSSDLEGPQVRKPGYKATHPKWMKAKDHWAYPRVLFKAPINRRIGFHFNTHNPHTEDQFISAAAHNMQIWDKSVFNIFKHVLLSSGYPTGLVVDVGANLGYFTLWAAAMGHRVVSFEPMDFNLRYLLSSIQRNEFGNNVTVYQNAVSNINSRVSLKPTDKTNMGNYQIQPLSKKIGSYGIDYVDSVRLDQVLDEDILLMKIDVEGYEARALDGALSLMCNNIVHHIELEFTTVKTDKDCSPHSFLCWMKELGYRISGLSKGDRESQDMDPSAFDSYPSEILLTLKEPSLPPALRMYLSGVSPNPCRKVMQEPDSSKWFPYKDKFCARAFISHWTDGLRPCVGWGGIEPGDQRIWVAMECDVRLGFECSVMQLDESKLSRVTKAYALRPQETEGVEKWIRDNRFQYGNTADEIGNEFDNMGGGGSGSGQVAGGETYDVIEDDGSER